LGDKPVRLCIEVTSGIPGERSPDAPLEIPSLNWRISHGRGLASRCSLMRKAIPCGIVVVLFQPGLFVTREKGRVIIVDMLH